MHPWFTTNLPCEHKGRPDPGHKLVSNARMVYDVNHTFAVYSVIELMVVGVADSVRGYLIFSLGPSDPSTYTVSVCLLTD